MINSHPLSNWQVSLVVSADSLPCFERALDGDNIALLASEIETGSDKGKWTLDAIYQDKPDLGMLKTALELASTLTGEKIHDIELKELEQKNWLQESLISFPPVSVGRYYIYGSHIKDPPPKTKLSLKIDAATAFGSGEHYTTKGCLMALQDISRTMTPARTLDMGCGSGILGLAAALTFRKPVFATDIDPESVRVTQHSAFENHLVQYMTVWTGNGYKPYEIKRHAPYDLVFSNILARPLTLMARDLAKNLSFGGYAILSGLLYRQEAWVLSAHRTVGLGLKKRYRLNGWSTLVVGHS